MSANGKPRRPFWFAPGDNVIAIRRKPDPPFEQIAALAERAELSMLEERAVLSQPERVLRIHAVNNKDSALADLIRLAGLPLPELTVDEEREVLALTQPRKTRKSSRRTNAIERHVRALVASGATLSRRGRGVRLSLRPEVVDGMLAAACPQPPRRAAATLTTYAQPK